MLDLHIHTTASDGTFTPEQVVRMAKRKGFTLVSVTDHDTMGGVKEALAAGRECNVEVIPGVEISAGVEMEVHMLGYGMSPDHPRMVAMMEDMKRARVERMVAIIDNLKGMGIDITQEEVEALADGAIGRPHIARVLIAHGVATDVRDAFRRYIGKGAPAYAERRKLHSADVIRNIRAAGGVPVLAHGGLLKVTETELNLWLDEMVKAGLMGLECYHNAHKFHHVRMLRGMAQDRGLLITGGSDFHGATRKDIDLGTGLGGWTDVQACRGKFLAAVENARKS